MAGLFPVSMYLAPYLGSETELLNLLRSSGWWFHIVGIFLFLNYLPYSKHFHIIMAFPNTWYSKLTPAGKLNSPESITREILTILNPSMNVETVGNEPVLLGAKDTNELSWKQLLDSYSCTECGRCTSSCPANLTGKKLSPRKIVMSVRDRIEDLEKNKESEKTLLNHFISAEELWACTTCNACVTECPVSIDPVSTIIELRRHMVMEQSSAPTSLNNMFTNIENNGSPWAFSAMDRFNWASDITISA
jgi:heterodisulfide reductase subunit C